VVGYIRAYDTSLSTHLPVTLDSFSESNVASEYNVVNADTNGTVATSAFSFGISGLPADALLMVAVVIEPFEIPRHFSPFPSHYNT
jgi:hypothetical protein